jgi:uroporphyrinogen-III synthase
MTEPLSGRTIVVTRPRAQASRLADLIAGQLLQTLARVPKSVTCYQRS